MSTRKERESRLRLDILRRRERLGTLLGRLLGSGALIPGSIYSRRRRCGKPECRCVRGQLHQDRVLAVRRSGRVVVRCLDPVGDAATEEAVVAWRLFRHQRHQLVEACRNLVQMVDRLGRLRQAKPGGLR
ncbi:MAG: DUF6788 family protein [Elusimicrobiota bacterium]